MKWALFILTCILCLPVYSQSTDQSESLGLIEVPSDTLFEWNCFPCKVSFPGGEEALMKFIQKNLRWPANGTCAVGTVYVRFVVGKDGKIKDPKILKSVPGAPEFDAEALRVINIMPAWVPGKMNGKSVECEYYLPVKFVISQ